ARGQFHLVQQIGEERAAVAGVLPGEGEEEAVRRGEGLLRAPLEFLEGLELPGIVCLEDR
ncbi:MAG: hypothetical protein SOY66_09555, partial [Evtepia sp.]|nr:hypothetical protein [Evtepia sp.]